MDPYSYSLPDFVLLSHEGRSLQMKQTQLTSLNIGKAFKLVPDTIILVSERGTVALPQEGGVFEDIDETYKWKIEGERVTTNSSGKSFGLSSSTNYVMPGLSQKSPGQWKPRTFPPLAAHVQVHSKKALEWIKCVEVCTLKGKDLMVVSEYPLSLDETTANVLFIQEKLSTDAFNGEKVVLMNSKNIPIADTDVSRGTKYWKTAKVVRAISENLYNKFRGFVASDPGPSSINTEYINIRTSSPNHLSDSDSDTLVQVTRKRKRYVPSPPPSETDVSKYQKILDAIEEIRDSVARLPSPVPPQYPELKQIFTCLICKEILDSGKIPLVPPCCKAVLVCRQCLCQWVTNTPVCPHCRSAIQIEDCALQPFIRPLFALLDADSQ